MKQVRASREKYISSIIISMAQVVDKLSCPWFQTNVRAVTETAARYCLAGVWLVGLVLAVFPVLRWPQERAFYSSNGLCFPLHIDDPFMLGWEYSAFVFLGINFSAVSTVSPMLSELWHITFTLS